MSEFMENLPYRSQCKCMCHQQAPGYAAMHFRQCCRPDPQKPSEPKPTPVNWSREIPPSPYFDNDADADLWSAWEEYERAVQPVTGGRG